MKNNKSKMVILGIIIVVFIVVLVLLINKKPSTSNVAIIPEDENAQVTVLEEIYDDFLTPYSLENASLVLDSSAYTNLITGTPFSESGIEQLKAIESSYVGTYSVCTLYSTYDPDTNTLKLNLKEMVDIDNEPFCLFESTKNYTLGNKDEEITYSENGLAHEVFSRPSL